MGRPFEGVARERVVVLERAYCDCDGYLHDNSVSRELEKVKDLAKNTGWRNVEERGRQCA